MTDSGFAVMGEANHVSSMTLGIAVGGYAGSGVGIWGECADKQTGFAGIFSGNVRVNGDFEVNGIKAAVVPMRDGSLRRVYCVESPESWFEDFGEARLKAGKVEIRIDTTFAALVRGDYHVFLTPYGDSNGLYVARRTSKSFTVREQRGGKSTLALSYRLVARRKDVVAPRLSKVKPLPSIERPPPEKPEKTPRASIQRAKKPVAHRRYARG